MAYIPSHQELKDHPKTRRAARRCGVSIPTMIGHLHLLWWWALDHGPDGDLSRFDSEDLADGAMWEGDPETFVKALVECGPGDSDGFLTSDGYLHDWDDYGGKYGQRVQAARKAAAARWQSDSTTNAMRTHSEGNADASGVASPPHDTGNAEESRGDKSRKGGARKRATQRPDDWEPNAKHAELARELGVNLDAERTQFCDFHAAKGSTFKDWDAAFRTWLRNAVKFGGARQAPSTSDGLVM